MAPLTLHLLADPLAVCRLEPTAHLPVWALAGPLWSMTRTPHELCVVTAAAVVPAEVQAERGWRAFAVAGPLAFTETGLLAHLSRLLADAHIPLFALSTYDTDYLLVREQHAGRAHLLLEAAGHEVIVEEG